MLRACDYGAPTIRRRFFLIARCDGQPIRWPEPTHADPDGLEVHAGLKKPWVPVADVLDFSLPCPSIFSTSEEIMAQYGIRAVRPLSEKTLRRIAHGIDRFVIRNPRPFLIQYHDGSEFRGQGIDKPLQTIDSSNRYGLVSAFISQFNNNSIGQEVTKPINTLTAQTNHFAEVCAFLVKYYGNGDNAVSCRHPVPTITAKDRMGLVTVYGQNYRIVDIGLRMLTPRELFDAQGFPPNYIIDVDADGKAYPKSEQVARCGNAVCPPIPTALVRANLPELCDEKASA